MPKWSTPTFDTLVRQGSSFLRDIPDGLNLESIQAQKDLDTNARTVPGRARSDFASVSDRSVSGVVPDWKWNRPGVVRAERGTPPRHRQGNPPDV